ncbi:MAG: sensor histidine kinase [Candidatus Marinamargulisbacteria bacterium]
MFVSAIPYFFIFNHFNLTLAANIVWGVLLAYVASFVFNYYNKPHVASLLEIATQSCILPFYSIYLGFESDAHLLMIPVALLPMIFYPKASLKRYRSIGFFFVLVGLLTIIVGHTYYSQNLPLIDDATLFIFSVFAYLTTFGLVIPQVNVFNRSEQQAQEALKKSKDAQLMLVQHADYARLVQSIAHEFKNPLQMLQGTAEIGLLQDNKNKEIFNTIINTVGRLNNVIEPMLTYLKTDNSYDFQSFNITNTINDILLLSKANCKTKGIHLKLINDAENSTTYGDPTAIGQVFINLMSNAMDAIGNNKGHIVVHLFNDDFMSDNQLIDGICIQVQDTGSGIEAEKLQTIFSPYESTKKSTNNVGLGLSIVSKIIKEHAGLISIESELNKGTTISVWLKLSNAPVATARQQTIFEINNSDFE